MEPEQVLFASVFVIGMFAGVFVIFLAMKQRSHQMEMQHRERMAMIEKGQVPLERPRPGVVPGDLPGLRSISVGIVIAAVGFGLMTIISIAGDSPEVGVGVGGAIVIVGGAFVATGMLRRSQATHWTSDDRPGGGLGAP